MAGIIASLVSKKPPPSEGEGGDMDKKMSMGAKERAAQALISAVKSGDAGGVASAFQRMYDVCATSGGEEYDEGV